MPIKGDAANLLYIICGIILIGFLIREIIVVIDIVRDVKYFDAEVERSEGKELEYWKKQKRREFLLLIPFAGLFMSRKRRR